MLYDVPHEIPFGIAIPIYFFLTGLSAGSFVLSALAYVFDQEKYKPLAKPGIVLAFLLLAVAPLFLISDLERPDRFWHLLVMFNPTSAISWGTVLLILYPLNCLIYGWYIWKDDVNHAKFFGWIGIFLAIAVHGYTGVILAAVETRALWHNPMMPLWFLVSAIVSGIALMIIVIAALNLFRPKEKRYPDSLLLGLGNMLVFAIAVDLLMVLAEVITLANGSQEAREALELITVGSFGVWFLGVEILLGALIPLGLLLLWKNVSSYAFASCLVMIGVFAMRYTVVIGGLTLPLG